jgi:hypothetical protein
VVVEAEVVADTGAGLRDSVIGVQVDLLIFDGPPEVFDEDVASPSVA